MINAIMNMNESLDRTMKNPLCTGYESPFGMSRRSFLNQLGMGLGGLALGSMVNPLKAVTDRTCFVGYPLSWHR